MIGPAMPSAELLAAAAKLTEAQNEFRYRFLKVFFFFVVECFLTRLTKFVSYDAS